MVNLIIALIVVAIAIMIILLMNESENYIPSDFVGERSNPKLADLIVTNNEKIKYNTAPYPLNKNFQSLSAKLNGPESPNNSLDPSTCLHENNRNREGMRSAPRTTKKDILHMYDMLQGPVDLGMANKMIATSKHAKQSFTNRSRFNRRAFNKYFVQELEEAANRGGWWDNDELDMVM